MKKSSYELDFFKWTQDQTELLRKKDLSHLDIDNLIEEIESLGRSDKRSLHSYLVVLLIHLLKKAYHSDNQGNSNSWESSIINSTREIKFLLEDSPSLKNELIKYFPKSYEIARKDAALESKIKIGKFPKECPWTIEEILGEK